MAECKPHLTVNEHRQLASAAQGYALCRKQYFESQQDLEPGLEQILGESNHWTCLPIESVIIRPQATSSIMDVALACAAALTIGSRCTVSADGPWMRTHRFLGELDQIAATAEPIGQLAAGLQAGTGLRVCGPVSESVRRAAIAVGIHCHDGPVSTHGRIELLNYIREQSVTVSYHRYGNLAGLRLQTAVRSGSGAGQ